MRPDIQAAWNTRSGPSKILIRNLSGRPLAPSASVIGYRGEWYENAAEPDHATPVKLRTHTAEPVPFVIYDSRRQKDNAGAAYNESIAARSDSAIIEKGHTLMDKFIKEALG